MKLSVKLFIIVLLGTIITLWISFSTSESKINLVTMGDGISLGITSYNVVGVSYNDYLKEVYENKNNLQYYNNEFSKQHMRIDDLMEILEKNVVGEKSKKPIKQILARADIITIGIGMDELIDLSIKNKLDRDAIDQFVSNYRLFLKTLRTFYDREIIVLGLYPAYDFSKGDVIDVNFQLQSIVGEYKGVFIDISALSLNPEYYSNSTSYYMNYKGHKAIFEIMRKVL